MAAEITPSCLRIPGRQLWPSLTLRGFQHIDLAMPTEKWKLTTLAFAVTFLVEYFCVLHGFGSFYQLSGDSLCQIGYWKILSMPWLSGSLAASATKPGQVFIFGILHQYFTGTALRLVLALFGAGLSLSLGLIAAEVGGAAGGVCAVFFSVGYLSEFVRVGDSTLFLLPLLFGGLYLYYCHSPRVKALGLSFLALTPLFRIEAVAAVGLVLLIHLLKREWRAFALGSVALAAGMGIWLAVLFRVQGEVSRFTSSAAAGYSPGPKVPFFAWLVRDLRGSLFQRSAFPCLVLILVGVAGTCLRFPKYRGYLVAFGPVLIIFVNYLFLGGYLSPRYFATAFAFGICVGTGVLFAILKRSPQLLPPRAALLPATVLIMAIGALFYAPWVTRLVAAPPPSPLYITDGLGLYREKLVPVGSRILSEDDALYVLLMNDPNRFSKIYTLQSFNIADEHRRRAILADTDFIYLLKGHFPWYYLFVNATVHRPNLDSDRFRGVIEEMIRSNTSAAIYGVALTPLLNDGTRLLLKVEHPAG